MRLRRTVRAVAAVAVCSALAALAPIVTGPTTAAAQTVTNPDLTASCGVNITLIIDKSNSISTTEADDIRDAARALIRSLVGTGSRVQVITFATQATAVVRSATTGGYTEDPTIANLAYYDASLLTDLPSFYAPGGDAGGTNWDDALEFARRAANISPLTVFLTDGDPTYYNATSPDGHGGTVGGTGTSTGTTDLARAIQEADYLRTGNRPSGGARPATHLFGVGVGLTTTTSEDRMRQVTGTDELTLGTGGQVLVNGVPGEFAVADYTIFSGFADLEFAFVRFVWALCSQSYTLKGTFQQADGTAVPVPAGTPLGFQVTLGPNAPNAWLSPATGTGTVVALPVDAAGAATFTWSPKPPSPVSELTTTMTGLPAGYVFNGVRCTADDPDDATAPVTVLDTAGPNQAGSERGVPTWAIPGGVNIHLDATCEVFVRQLRGETPATQRVVLTASAPSPRGGRPVTATAVVDVRDDASRSVQIVSWRTE